MAQQPVYAFTLPSLQATHPALQNIGNFPKLGQSVAAGAPLDATVIVAAIVHLCSNVSHIYIVSNITSVLIFSSLNVLCQTRILFLRVFDVAFLATLTGVYMDVYLTAPTGQPSPHHGVLMLGHLYRARFGLPRLRIILDWHRLGLRIS